MRLGCPRVSECCGEDNNTLALPETELRFFRPSDRTRRNECERKRREERKKNKSVCQILRGKNEIPLTPPSVNQNELFIKVHYRKEGAESCLRRGNNL
jgi:hypothetical protein